MRLALLLLLLVSLAPLAMADQLVFTKSAVAPSAEIANQAALLMGVVVALMLTMVVLAAAVYVGGQFFGAETRAKATVWAHNMLAAVGVSAVIIAVIYFILPEFFTTGQIMDVNVALMITQLKGLAETSLIFLMVIFLVLAAGAYAMGQMFGAETRARAAVWATGLLAGAIIAAVIYALLYAIVPSLVGAISVSTYVGGDYATAIFGIVMGIAFVILITYLAAKVFKVAEWEAYLNIEMSNLMGAFLIIFFVLGLFAVGNLVALTWGNGAATPPQAAITYIQNDIASSAMKAMVDVYQLNACTSMLSTFSRRIGEFVLTQTYKVFPGIDTFVQITSVLGVSVLTLYNTASVQVTLLYLADALMLKFFLPAGLILRFFPPTRDAGAFLIALAFGFQIVFPTTYMMNKAIYESIFQGDSGDQPYYHSPTLLIQSLCGPFKYGVAGFLLNPDANPLFSLLPAGAGTFLSALVSESLLNAVSMAEFVPIMRFIASLSLLALFMPALSMMITIAFINSMTKFIVYKV
ncbi:hypothetical protein H0O00_02610 [Candidatus Micrarchaeota archaeon]|nr:hypothetical protein [Candidatus Micrarchaeota archaeon]